MRIPYVSFDDLSICDVVIYWDNKMEQQRAPSTMDEQRVMVIAPEMKPLF